jgi:hypothetical protein
MKKHFHAKREAGSWQIAMVEVAFATLASSAALKNACAGASASRALHL